MLNPYGNREKIEGRVLYVFLKLVYDPYWDGSQESMSQLIDEASNLMEDIKLIQREQETPLESESHPDETGEHLVEVRE